jgi:plastocyanin
MRAVAFLVLLALALAGCSDDEGGDTPAGEAPTTAPTAGGGGSATTSASTSPASPPAAGPATTHASVMRSNQFEPAELTVRVGDTVRWTTEDVQAHNVVSESAAAQFRSPDVSIVPVVYQQEFSHTFTTAGTVDYLCEYHSGMVGTVSVVA